MDFRSDNSPRTRPQNERWRIDAAIFPLASALVLLLAAVPALTQDHIPKLIDVHIHYDGEPGSLKSS